MVEISEKEIMNTWNTDLDIMVSIKCITFNHERYIEQAIDSFLLQITKFPFEIIVHDDKSTDKTLVILNNYVLKYPNIIKVIKEDVNLYSLGKTNLINYKMDKIAKGKYIALCEGDDYWIDRNKLQIQFDMLEEHSECSIAFSRTKYVTINGEDMGETIPPQEVSIYGVFDLEEFIKEQFGNCKWIVHTSSFFYRSIYADEMREERNKRFKNFPYGDITIVLFLLSKGNGIITNNVQSCYRYLSGGYNSMVKANIEKNIYDMNKLCDGLRDFDKETEYIYHKYIQQRIIRAGFDIDRLKRSTFSLFKKSYWIQIPIKEHIGAILESLSPTVYKIFKRIKQY